MLPPPSPSPALRGRESDVNTTGAHGKLSWQTLTRRVACGLSLEGEAIRKERGDADAERGRMKGRLRAHPTDYASLFFITSGPANLVGLPAVALDGLPARGLPAYGFLAAGVRGRLATGLLSDLLEQCQARRQLIGSKWFRESR